MGGRKLKYKLVWVYGGDQWSTEKEMVSPLLTLKLSTNSDSLEQADKPIVAERTNTKQAHNLIGVNFIRCVPESVRAVGIIVENNKISN
jgi:hypothetical protein